jgi:hypothetical protein
VEKLASDFQSQVSMIFERPKPPRNLFLCETDRIENLPLLMRDSSTRYCLLLLIDARPIESENLSRIASRLTGSGLVCFCAWGPDCKRVHDLFDEGAMEANLALTGDDVIMTTWHAEESLGETLWDFVHSTFPTEGLEIGCNDWIVACIGNEVWSREIRRIAHDAVYHPPKE